MARFLAPSVLMLAMFLTACSSVAPKTDEDAKLRHSEVIQAIAELQAKDFSLEKLFNSAYAYAIFPNVTSGSLGLGKFSGDGEVFKGGNFAGYASISGGSVGKQVDGQDFIQVVFFQNEAAFNNVKNGSFESDAKATAVTIKPGEGAQADYTNGIIAFALSRKGLMVQAAVGGQKLSFHATDKIGGSKLK